MLTLLTERKFSVLNFVNVQSLVTVDCKETACCEGVQSAARQFPVA